MGTSDVGTGATLTLGTSTWTPQITSISWDDVSREVIDITHLGVTGGREFGPSDLYDPGGISIEGNWDPNLDSAKVPPYAAAAETFTITFPLQAGDATAATVAGTGFITNFSVGIPLEDRITFTATIKYSGDLTVTAAST